MDFLTNLSEANYYLFIYCWGALGIASAFIIHFMKLLPISNKTEGSQLSFLGSINKRTGWIVMETPVLVVITLFFLLGDNPINLSAIFVAAFIFHYFNRALIYPFRIKVSGKTMPISMMLSSMTFYIINGYLLGYYFGSIKSYELSWLYDPRFFIGMGLFIFGFYINVTSDNILINLRKPGETGYKIPEGGFFRYISCPNYFGEIVEWIGFAIMSWSLPALVYALWVVLPLFAQGISAHKWYIKTFGEQYPDRRKAVIPGII